MRNKRVPKVLKGSCLLFIFFFIQFFFLKNLKAGIYGVPCYLCHFKPEYNTCLGCHGGGSSKIGYIGTVAVPKVLHADPTGDLAGGNYAYITGLKASAYSNKNRLGHNVINLGASYVEDNANFYYPPGTVHPERFTADWRNKLTCAGYHGCHGYREQGNPSKTDFNALWGAHHNNQYGAQVQADKPQTSYRFLLGVKGYEAGDWQNTSPTSHNEYFGSTSPLDINNGANCAACHDGSYVKPRNNTISGFCATCHGIYHDSVTTGSSSPWLRHPTDRIIPNKTEFLSYTTYDVSVPVARTSVPSSPSSALTPGSDVVMCLSCHYAHAGPNPSMLRWSQDELTGPVRKGCRLCHGDK